MTTGRINQVDTSLQREASDIEDDAQQQFLRFAVQQKLNKKRASLIQELERGSRCPASGQPSKREPTRLSKAEARERTQDAIAKVTDQGMKFYTFAGATVYGLTLLHVQQCKSLHGCNCNNVKAYTVAHATVQGLTLLHMQQCKGLHCCTCNSVKAYTVAHATV